MLGANGDPVKIVVNGFDREDLYEKKKNGKWLSRRVELPTWLSELASQWRQDRKYLLEQLQTKTVRHPEIEIGESHGHILIEAMALTGQDYPCVGVDIEVIDKIKARPPTHVMFHVYLVDYIPFERWAVKWEDFMKFGIQVTGKHGFSPQITIPVSHLIRVG